MSVFGSLFTAVSGLAAQSATIAMISNNIANVSTVGYKRTDGTFSSLVTSQGRETAYSPGSVRSVQNARINEQGILQQSGSATDIAISGNGFFVVRPSASDPLAETVYTRSGSFREDASGILRNTSGFYLMGWPLDQNGNLPAAQANLSSLVPIDVAFLGGLTQPTTQASLSMNLKSTEVQTTYPVAAGFSPDFTRGIKVFDSLGSSHDLTLRFKKMASPTASAIGNKDMRTIVGPFSANAPFTGAETFNITVPNSVPAGPTLITLNGDVNKLLADLNAIKDANLNPLVYANLDSNGFLTIRATNYGGGNTITLADGVGTPLALANKLGMAAEIGVNAPAAPQPPALLATPAQTPNTEGWWTIEYTTPTGAIVQSGLVNFMGNGQLNATPDVNRQVLTTISNIDWGNGSNLQDIDFNLAGLSQFSGEYNVLSATQNGSELGLRTGVSIDDEGYVSAQFSNGQSSRIFKLPIATFANANGLDELTGNVFRETGESGSFNLREAGLGSAGNIAGGSLEASNVDLAAEFSKMIITQRAYSANTKIISTADQMTQELLQLR